MIEYLIDNVDVTCGNSLFRQKIGIPMGTDCAPFLANLFLFSYEYEWIMEQKKNNIELPRKFNRSARYIDDLITINNNGLMKQYMNDIYLSELELKHENPNNNQHASYLDLNIHVENKEIITTMGKGNFGSPMSSYILPAMLLMHKIEIYYLGDF